MDAVVKEASHTCEEMKVALATIDSCSCCAFILCGSLTCVLEHRVHDQQVGYMWRERFFFSKSMAVFWVEFFFRQLWLYADSYHNYK